MSSADSGRGLLISREIPAAFHASTTRAGFPALDEKLATSATVCRGS
jgi:hypothetical protein